MPVGLYSYRPASSIVCKLFSLNYYLVCNDVDGFFKLLSVLVYCHIDIIEIRLPPGFSKSKEIEGGVRFSWIFKVALVC